MPTNTTTPTPDATFTKAVAAALADHPDGTTAAVLATDTGLSELVVRRILGGLVDAGTATRTPGTGRGKQRTADTWAPIADPTGPQPQTPADTDDSTASPTPAGTDPNGPAAAHQPTSAPEADSTEASTDAPVPPAKVRNRDKLKVAVVADVMREYPKGVTAADICDESGLRGQIVSRVLGAMEAAGAATRRKPEDNPNGVELWVRGEADLDAVDLTVVAVRTVCPTCHRPLPRRSAAVPIIRTSIAPGHNGSGQPTLPKNALRGMVRDFLNEHPGHEFTPATIARELDRSSGAVGNALDKLALAGEAVLVKERPNTYSAAPTDTSN